MPSNNRLMSNLIYLRGQVKKEFCLCFFFNLILTFKEFAHEISILELKSAKIVTSLVEKVLIV